MCDLICDVITFCVWSCDIDIVDVYDKIMIDKQKKRENMEIIIIIIIISYDFGCYSTIPMKINTNTHYN